MKYSRHLIAILLIGLMSGARLRADFDDTGVGARPMGMGSAFVALADDVYALYYNPAGLRYQKRSEFATEYERLYWGLSDDSDISGGFLGYVYPLRFYFHEQTRVQKSTHTVETILTEKIRDFGVVGVGLTHFGLVDVYQEDIISLAWGRQYRKRFSYGLTLKMLTEKYTQDPYTRVDPVFDYGSTSSLTAFSTDIGFLYNLAPRLFVGLVVMDANQPDIGLKSSEKLPMSIKTGICYREKSLRVLMDIISKDSDLRVNSGAERWFFKEAFGIRGGTSLGSRNLRDITIGVSWNLKKFQIDYGFRFPLSGIEETIGSHRVSLVCRFGRTPEEELEPGSIEAELVKLEKERRELKAELKDAIEMKEKIEQVLIEEALARVREKIRAVRYIPSSKRKKEKRQETASGPAGMQTHIVRRGDTLRKIAGQYFGTERKWLDIYNLNRDKVGRGGSVKKGTLLLIPAASETVSFDVKKKPKQSDALKPKPAKKITAEKPAPKKIIPKMPVKTIVPKKTAAAASPKSKVPAGKRTHTVKAGETIRAIAIQYYHNASKWKDIYQANKTKVRGGRVEEGTVLDIP